MVSAPDRSATPAVILLDVYMPGLDGFGLELRVPGSTVQTLETAVAEQVVVQIPTTPRR